MNLMERFLWNGWAQVAAAALALAIVAGLFEWRRAHRKNADAVGLMPWQPIMILALIFALLSGILAFAR